MPHPVVPDPLPPRRPLHLLLEFVVTCIVLGPSPARTSPENWSTVRSFACEASQASCATSPVDIVAESLIAGQRVDLLGLQHRLRAVPTAGNTSATGTGGIAASRPIRHRPESIHPTVHRRRFSFARRWRQYRRAHARLAVLHHHTATSSIQVIQCAAVETPTAAASPAPPPCYQHSAWIEQMFDQRRELLRGRRRRCRRRVSRSGLHSLARDRAPVERNEGGGSRT